MDEIKYQNLKRGERGAMISIAAYICLSALKLIVGVIAGSAALKADGLNNATDIVASIAVLIGLRISRKPPDENHHYGHWKAENIASLTASFIMMTIGLQVLFETGKSILEGGQESPDMIAAWTGVFSAVVMYFVYRYNSNLAREIDSQAVMAAAKDNISDAWVSIGTAVGIIGAQFGLPWLDTVTALIVGLIICKTAWEIFRDASHHLTDGFDENEVQAFKELIVQVDGVDDVKDIRARNYGNNTVVDIVIYVDNSIDIGHAHDISTEVEEKLKEEFMVYDVHVHVEPSE